MSELKNYLTSRPFWKNMMYAIGILFVFMLFTATCARIYTHHNRSYAVPDFSNMALSDAIKLIEKKKMKYEIFDSLYVSNKEPGTILDQHPKPGFLVKKRRTIFLTINASAPEKIAMPNLVGITLREGKARLESYGLILGVLSYRYDISKNVILEQRRSGKVIQAGDSIPKGCFIDLVLGKGLGNESEKVPNLVGLTVEQAKYRLADAMFSLGATVPDGSFDINDPKIIPLIYKQKPISDESIRVPVGSTITVWISVDSTLFSGDKSSDDEEYILDELNDYDKNDSYTD